MKKIVGSIIAILIFTSISNASENFKSITYQILRNDDGTLRYLQTWSAYHACERIGMHLPSIREFAMLSESLGAQGISSDPKADFTEVLYAFIDSPYANSISKFYFNAQGYKAPSDDLGKHFFQTSSYMASGNIVEDPYIYVFDGFTGKLRRSTSYMHDNNGDEGRTYSYQEGVDDIPVLCIK